MKKPDVAVSAVNLTRRFDGFTAVDSISLDIHRGEIFGFLGANGAGKTTAIRMFCGLLEPTAGSATVGGIDVARNPEQVKQAIGYMSQKFSLYEDLTVRENIEFYGGVYGLTRSQIRERLHRLLEELNLGEQQNTVTGELPLGWKQRLALSAALLHNPDIVFLDEPTGGVDPISRRNFWRIIHDLGESGKTIFVTTHYMDEAEYCNRLSIMYHGKIIEMGTPSELKQRHSCTSMQQVFLHLVGKRGGADE